jgi:hypothetical protein
MGKRNENISERERESRRISSKLSKEKKSALLGESYDGACYKLRKMIMFKMAQLLKMDICVRCGKKIEDVDDFTTEHITLWAKTADPRKFFYDFNNIAFSHTSCNYARDGSQRFYKCRNETGFRGVSQIASRKNNPYVAKIKINGKAITLGYYSTAEEAGQKYDIKAMELWGDKAITNYPLALINKS